jgi:hypothetical protein
MRYLVKAKVKPGKEKSLLEAIESGRLGQGCGWQKLHRLRNSVDSGGVAPKLIRQA